MNAFQLTGQLISQYPTCIELLCDTGHVRVRVDEATSELLGDRLYTYLFAARDGEDVQPP